ncbi:thermonuclease family protein [Microaerobacter geothermalis]|uniref:thermonuclease family protein n=1 Tax=Microaerobacter geothermalis TaxID=674972 RepID=UPI001F32EC7C|nr:thermonuclease family protein [Microaerobacter geothermalis]MCF6092779.1 thermonuclease family protein [Microaerobacter geothermalis]
MINVWKKGDPPFLLFILLTILLLGGTSPGCSSKQMEGNYRDGPTIPEEKVKVKVIRVVDGDTFVIDGNQRVRLIGIDTPESVDPRRPVEFYGKEASQFSKKMLEGKEIYLVKGTTPVDKYNRILAWVWLLDGTFVNGELVRQGYAQVYTFKDNPEYAQYLLNLQREAREAGRGLWSENGPEDKKGDAAYAYIASQNSKVYHEFGCPGAEGIEERNKLYFPDEQEAINTGRRMCRVKGCRG